MRGLAAVAVGLLVVPAATLALAPPTAFAQVGQDQIPANAPEGGVETGAPAPEAQDPVSPSASASPTEPSPSATQTAPGATASGTAARTPTEKGPTAPIATDAGSGPTITSDLTDYAPGGTVTLTGVGWHAGEVVTIVVNDTGGLSWRLNQKVVADADGRLTLIFDLPNYYVPDYDVTANGELSGLATTTFTDATGPWQYWMTSPSPATSSIVHSGGTVVYTLNSQKAYASATVSGAVMTLTLTGGATFTAKGGLGSFDGGVSGIGTNTVTWSGMTFSPSGTNVTRTITVTATVLASAQSGSIVAVTGNTNDPSGNPSIGGGRVDRASHNVASSTVGDCSLASPGSGEFSRSICWFDLGGYNATVAAASGGQSMQQRLRNGYVLSYTITAGTITNVVAHILPTWGAAFLGNIDPWYQNNYLGISGKPALYQQSAGKTILTMTGISLEKNGVPVTGFALVGADAESTDGGESITWTSDKVLTSIGALGNACGGPLVMSTDNKQATCNAGPSPNKSGAAILYTQDPTEFTQTMVGAGLQAVAFGVMVSGIQLNKQIVNQLPGDQFRISVKGADLTELGSATNSPDKNTVSTEQVSAVSSDTEQEFTMSEVGVGDTDLANYKATWKCTINAGPYPAAEISHKATVRLKDIVACTITNTAPVLTLRTIVDNTAGGDLAPSDWALTATSTTTGNVVTTASNATVPVPAGEYKLLESSSAPNAAWYATSAWSCNGVIGNRTVTVAAGEDVTCTITKTAIPPKIAVWKTTVGAAGGPFVFSATGTKPTDVVPLTTIVAETRIQVDADKATTGVQPFTAANIDETVTISELTSGWTIANASCSNGSTTVGSLIGTTFTIPKAALVRGAVITCDFSNRQAVATWSTVDAGSTSTLLRGSEWTLTGPSYPTATTIVDCASSPCAGPDKDPVAGQFSVALLSGSYTLFEKTAPVGFQLDALTHHDFSITADGVTEPLGPIVITNSRLVVPTLPLTGGASSEAFLLAGAVLIASAGTASWRHRRRLLTSS